MNWTKPDVPDRFKGLYRQAMRGRSRKAAIRCHCLMCCGWQQMEVELCTAPGCPLYPYRRSLDTPVEKAGDNGAESPGRVGVVQTDQDRAKRGRDA